MLRLRETALRRLTSLSMTRVEEMAVSQYDLDIFMLAFKLVYSDDYFLPIGAHVFPAAKYRMIHDRLLQTGLADANDFIAPPTATDEDILLVHTPAYVNKLKTGTLTPREEMTL